MSSIRRAAVSKSTEVYKIRMCVPERIQVQPSVFENCPLYSIFPKDFKVISDYLNGMYILSINCAFFGIKNVCYVTYAFLRQFSLLCTLYT